MTPTPPEPSPEPSASSRRAFLRTGLTAAGAAAAGAGGMYAAKRPGWSWKEPTFVPHEVTPAKIADDVAKGRGTISYAQFGEDLVAGGLFYSIQKGRPETFLDIGAYDPIISNNTYLFYLAGARGVLVEPNPGITNDLRTARPGDTVLPVGIGITDDPSADYYVMEIDQLNTFSKEQAELLKTQGHTIKEVIKMPLVNINKVIAEHFKGKAPDFLSIDIEGLDFAVLNTLDYARFRPKVICAETLVTGTLRHNQDTLKLMTEKGYELRGMTYPNTFFIDKKLVAGK
jgi:FkbM family methyltransferase